MLTLAHRLKRNRHEVIFICRQLKGNLIDLVKNTFTVVELPEPCYSSQLSNHCVHAAWLEIDYKEEISQTKKAISELLIKRKKLILDWLIVDHYAIEQQFHTSLNMMSHYILQVDDLADRRHNVDVLLDQNYYQQGRLRYDNYISPSTLCLCGPQFALLREAFELKREQLPSYDSRLLGRKVVVFFGGIDIDNETQKALKGLLMVDSDDHIDIIIGMNNPHKAKIEAMCKINAERTSLYIQVNNMEDFFSSAYLYVGAVGATTWERCVLALPGIVCSVASNQVYLARDLHQINGHEYLGCNTQLQPEDYKQAYQHFLMNPALLRKQSDVCTRLVEGDGCNQVVRQLEEISGYNRGDVNE